jgi:hypothetical protein
MPTTTITKVLLDVEYPAGFVTVMLPLLVVFVAQVIPAAPPPLEAMVIPPDELVIVTFAPAVKFA